MEVVVHRDAREQALALNDRELEAFQRARQTLSDERNWHQIHALLRGDEVLDRKVYAMQLTRDLRMVYLRTKTRDGHDVVAVIGFHRKGEPYR